MSEPVKDKFGRTLQIGDAVVCGEFNFAGVRRLEIGVVRQLDIIKPEARLGPHVGGEFVCTYGLREGYEGVFDPPFCVLPCGPFDAEEVLKLDGEIPEPYAAGIEQARRMVDKS